MQIEDYLPKPRGAMWASRADDKGDTWCKWVLENNYYPKDFESRDHIIFHLRKTTRVLRLHTDKDYEYVIHKYTTVGGEYNVFLIFDFARIAQDYDVIDYKSEGYRVFDMYGWNSDSICILNKDVIVLDEVHTKKKNSFD